jgi:beta-glucosidase
MFRRDAARCAVDGADRLVGALLALVVILAPAVTFFAASSAASADQRHGAQAQIRALIGQMTLDEKLSFVSPTADPAGFGEAGYIPGVPRLGIPSLRLTDGPAGVRLLNEPGASTALPAPIELASSFDDQLARQYGQVLGLDTRALGQDVVLGPMTNIIRVPFGGRNFETFSEDPLLAAHMAAGEVQGIQSQGAIATVKHYAENNQENNRTGVDVQVGEQALRQIELPAFKAAVDAGAGAVMCAYNSVNGRHSCSNDILLNQILKTEWGFRGWVMSDWGASQAPTDILAGLDQEMLNLGVNPPHFTTQLKAAIQAGTIPESALDSAVARILGQMQRFGLLAGAATDRPQRDPGAEAKVAQSVAEHGAVLLKNSDGALPLGASDRTIAVIGPTGKTPKVGGGGSAHVIPASAASPLDAITQRAGPGTSVAYATGIDTTGAPIPASALSPAPPFDATGSAMVNPGPPLAYNGTLTVPTDGDYTFVFSPPTYGPLSIDGRGLLFCILEACSGTVHLTAGQHTISVVGINAGTTPAPMRLTWITPEAAAQAKADAVALAKQVQTPIVFAYDDETEGVDRSTLSLPAHQDDLISAVADANPNTIVVLNTGSSITMPWLNKVRAVLDMYYPGENGAEATARLLFGDVNPSGKLTQTFPASDTQTSFAGNPLAYPGVNNEEHYSEGIYIGYRWYDENNVTPLFPLGYGRSYTSFAYRDLKESPHGAGVKVKFRLTNVGHRAGADVAQAYLGPSPDSTLPQAVRALAGYEKVFLQPGETRWVTLTIPAQQLESWDPASHRWQLGTGPRSVWVGDSSADLPLHTTLYVRAH